MEVGNSTEFPEISISSGNFHFQCKFPPTGPGRHRRPGLRRDLRRPGRPRGGMCQWRCSGPSGGLHGLRRPRGGGHGTGMSALLFRLYDLELVLLHVHVHVVISRNRKRYVVMTNADTKLFIYELLWMSRKYQLDRYFTRLRERLRVRF